MANWIVTEIELTGDRLFLERLEKIINDCNDGPIDDGSNWVGHIFGALGINVKNGVSELFGLMRISINMGILCSESRVLGIGVIVQRYLNSTFHKKSQV